MALHWQYIKGFYQNTSSNKLYTFINFKNSTNIGENLLPDIYINTANTLGSTNYGHIVTNNIATTFLKTVTFDTITTMKSRLQFADETCGIYKDASNLLTLYSNKGIWLRSTEGKITFSTKTQVTSTSGTAATSTAADFIVDGYSYFAKTINVNSDCKAKYFNATSDIRAKENIEAVTESMLDIVNKIQVYTFNYKKDPAERLIGVIAQEIKDININGATFVDNLEATGENDDFMSVHESKLIYILLGAVQELSKEIDELKKKIGE